MADDWHGMRVQHAMLNAQIVAEARMDARGPMQWYSLRLDNKIIPLGDDKHFADMLCFAVRRNAEAFERPARAEDE